MPTHELKMSTQERRREEFAYGMSSQAQVGAGQPNPTLAAEQQLCQLEPTLAGASPSMARLRQLIMEVAPTRASVMIHGESGVGAEVVARAIHRIGKQSGGPFVAVSMAAIQPGWTEYRLFGRDEGSLADGAPPEALGHCEAADGGTLFLDEVAEMEMQAQPRLFRFLQEGGFQRVGSQQLRRASVRVISATNRDPATLVADGCMRDDLFFRLHIAPIYIAPLRDRPEDIVDLANYFLRQAAARHERPVVAFADNAIRLLQEQDWPGNARQLENVVERLVVFARTPVIDADHIPFEDQLAFPYSAARRLPAGRLAAGAVASTDTPVSLTPIERHERGAIVDALRRTDGHVVLAARFLGLGQATVYRKIKHYAIPRERRPRLRHAK